MKKTTYLLILTGLFSTQAFAELHFNAIESAKAKVNKETATLDDDYNFKNFLVNFTPIKHFYFNLTNAQNLSGRDITNLPYTKQHYYPSGNAKVKSILALGKLAQCDNNTIIFGVIRAIYNGRDDKTTFFIDQIDAKGKSIKFETVGMMSKEINGGPYTAGTDLGVYQANDKVAIVIEQREYKRSKTVSNTKRTLMIDQLTCKTWDKE